MGTRVPVIVSIVAGVLGIEACNDKAGEVLSVFFISSINDLSFVFCFSKVISCLQVKQNDQGMHICPSFAILLTIGYLPGIKVDVIPVIQSKEVFI